MIIFVRLIPKASINKIKGWRNVDVHSCYQGVSDKIRNTKILNIGKNIDFLSKMLLSIEDMHSMQLMIYVTEPPENDKANRAMIKLLSDYLKISSSRIKILKGSKCKNKIIKITIE